MAKSLRTPEHLALMQVLIEIRKEAGITQQELADILDRPQSYVAKVETGERRLDVVEMIAWAGGIGLSPADLMTKVVRAIPAPKAPDTV